MGGFINITDDDDDAFVVMYGIVSDFNGSLLLLLFYAAKAYTTGAGIHY